jgi:hypothetical protein
VIPKAAGDSPLVQSYARLRALGLRVQVRFAGMRTLNVTSLQDPIVEHLFPAPGTHVKHGGLVTILAAPGLIGSPVALKSDPHYRVPSFVGRRAAVALRWADTHDMNWAIPQLPPLRLSRAHRLFDAYRVVAQRPRPGALLGEGHLTRSGGYRVTPLLLQVEPG